MSGNAPPDWSLILGSSIVQAACASPERALETIVSTAQPCNDNISVSVVGDITGDEIGMLVFGIITGIVLLVTLIIVTTLRMARAWRQTALHQLIERGSDDPNGTSDR
ncbi:hypothetical protein D6T64_02880 [Cryobacterium melibiosiphilum]|uniref:Uncharacterized protein n=1 Tax=Cryobacterium melibiosiphilum TaxID=995039 RepID=A0A3A5MLH2_9MICO|nr:hypothetical protein [Cryobacterium melibiosiphilum]RJT90950.1 hypothetical protein D6T64_02880 [Cryobacterium melibiosiphilum]